MWLKEWSDNTTSSLVDNVPKNSNPAWFQEMLKGNPDTKQLPLNNKYEQIPTSDTANWMLVSMGDISRVGICLDNFRKPVDTNTLDSCPSTLIWSGTEGNNVPVQLFKKYPIGFTLDPNKIMVPYADFLAAGTSSKIPSETRKATISTTKHPVKKGRVIYAGNDRTVIANHAKWEHRNNDGVETGIYHQEGSAQVFANNVWRKYYKRGNLDLNEALVQQKGLENPINGIIIRAELFDKVSEDEKRNLIGILRKNPHLKMFIYDKDLKEHIVRVIDNDEAIKFLQSKINTKKITKQEIESLQPFKGFPLEASANNEPSNLSSRCIGRISKLSAELDNSRTSAICIPLPGEVEPNASLINNTRLLTRRRRRN